MRLASGVACADEERGARSDTAGGNLFAFAAAANGETAAKMPRMLFDVGEGEGAPLEMNGQSPAIVCSKIS